MQCPICKKSIADNSTPEAARLLPFCSDRCKLIDLGRWLDGSYQVPVCEDENTSDASSEPD